MRLVVSYKTIMLCEQGSDIRRFFAVITVGL